MSSGQRGNTAMKVLVVDGDPDTAEMLSLLLHCLGHAALGISDSQAAVKVCQEMRPVVVLLEIGMPHLDGFSVCRAIRSDLWPAPRLIALTGWCTDSLR